MHKAVAKVFAAAAFIQRCQWHKRENIVAYLPKAQQAAWRRKLERAYAKPTYKDAKAALTTLRRELLILNESAAHSLDEGPWPQQTRHIGFADGHAGRAVTGHCHFSRGWPGYSHAHGPGSRDRVKS